MRLFLVAALVLGCASQGKETPAAAATVMAGSLPSNAPAPEPKTTPESGPVGAKPVVPGSSSAASSRASSAGSEGDDGACATDADCTFTRVAPGACCPMLCTPRVVTRKAADALDDHVKSCARSHACPQPGCRPPRMTTAPACVESRCVAKVRDETGMQ